MKRKYIILISILPALIIIVGAIALANGIHPIGFGMHDNIAQVDGLALSGYDPISFRSGEPAKGDAGISMEWKGAKWQFTSEENKATFMENPDAYCPAFGGHCALAVSTGFAVDGDPTSYSIINDTLYIFSEEAVKESYMSDFDNNLKASNQKWK